ncbi:uncharacterized protein LOC111326497 isoform X2 [Stylophora pistillata]|uniref:uncharacterized protein LOC111326497 isoform X2 n=1 Tax=Stylophora pistillata TaxID=50429 RepID=UPI000C038E45|nr:uncharacterized protein LOC111326497 isoform X2 [Stylophora pistillata]
MSEEERAGDELVQFVGTLHHPHFANSTLMMDCVPIHQSVECVERLVVYVQSVGTLHHTRFANGTLMMDCVPIHQSVECVERLVVYVQLYLFMVNIHNGAPGLLARGHAQVGLSNVPVHEGEEETVADGDHIHNQGNATHKVAQCVRTLQLKSYAKSTLMMDCVRIHQSVGCVKRGVDYVQLARMH